MDTPVKPHRFRKRQFKRTTTGCMTCRARRKKCDEQRPCCTACFRNGMDCTWPSSSTETLQVSAAGHKGLHDGCRGTAGGAQIHPALWTQYSIGKELIGQSNGTFRYYTAHVAPGLIGVGSDFVWRQLVPQLAQRDVCVGLSLNALALHHEAFERRTAQNCPKDAGLLERALLHSYNSALHCLQAKIYLNDPQESQSILVSCLMLCLLECLRGSMHTALGHLRGAIQLIRELTRGKLRPGELMVAVRLFQALNINAELVLLVERLRITAGGYFFTDFADDDEYGMIPFQTHQSFPQSFQTLSESAWSHSTLFSRVRGTIFENMTAERRVDPCVREILLQDLKLWRAASMSHLASLSPEERRESQGIVTKLGISYSFMQLFLQAAGPDGREGMRKADVMFGTALDYCQALIDYNEDQQRESKPERSFTMISSLVPCLWYVTSRTYNIAIRERAISLLEQASIRECFWDSGMTARLARHLAETRGSSPEIWEESFRSLSTLLDEKNIHSSMNALG